MEDSHLLLDNNSVDVVNFLLNKYRVNEFYYRAYVIKTEDGYDQEIPAVSLENLEQIYKEHTLKDPRYLIAFQSRVLTPTGYKHFPMIDFSNYIIKDLGLEQVENVLKRLGEIRGFILDSGRCFHYYGDRLLSGGEWSVFMKNCAKYPEIGERYMSHQLRRGKAALRLVTNDSKPKNPKVVRLFELK